MIWGQLQQFKRPHVKEALGLREEERLTDSLVGNQAISFLFCNNDGVSGFTGLQTFAQFAKS
jgi:hypothetical protein